MAKYADLWVKIRCGVWGATNQSVQRAVARARSSSRYDVQNGIVIRRILNHVDAAEREAKAEMQERKDPDDPKYTEYRIHQNIRIGKMKARLMAIALEENGRNRKAAWNRWRGELVRNILPGRRGRALAEQVDQSQQVRAKPTALSLTSPALQPGRHIPACHPTHGTIAPWIGVILPCPYSHIAWEHGGQGVSPPSVW